MLDRVVLVRPSAWPSPCSVADKVVFRELQGWVMKFSAYRRLYRHVIPVLAGLTLSQVLPASVLAETYSFTDLPSAATTYSPSIAGGTNTNLTSYSSSFQWRYTLYSFDVDTTGTYSVSATTSPVVNTMYVLNGTFTPSSTFPPATPISQFIASNFSGTNTTVLSLQLVQGQTYSVLVAYNTGGTNYSVVLTFNGAGCVNVHLNTCSSPAEELKLQAAQQGVMLSDVQSRAVVGQLRQRMQSGGVDRTPTGSLVHSYASEPKKDYASVFGLAMADDDGTARWTAWADTGADGVRGNWNPDFSGYQVSQQFGLDYRFANGWVAGSAVGAGVFGNDFDNGGELSGSTYWIAPYLGMTFDDWMVTLQVAYAYVDYDSFSVGAGVSGETHGQRFSASASLARQFDLGNEFYAVPEVTLGAGRELIANVSSLTNGDVEDPRFFSARIGGELGYKLSGDSRVYGLAFADYASSNADASATSLSTGFKSTTWSATLGGGFDVKLADNIGVNLEGRVRGLGSDTLVYGGNARLSVQF